MALLAGKPSIAAAPICPVAAPPFALPAASEKATLSADRASLQNGIATASGHARLTYRGQALHAPSVTYNRRTTRAIADDGLRYYRPGVYITAADANVRIADETGDFHRATYTILGNGGRGSAARVVAEGGGDYALTEADYSTCAGQTKAWQLVAQRIRLDRDSGRASAYNARLRLYGIPVLYTPYLNFPIDNRRHSGLLTPTIGTSSNSGFEFALPYYFNIAPNYDATLVGRVLADRGVQLSGQFRYLGAHHRGELDGAYLPADQKYGGDRSLVHFEHIGRFNRHAGIQIDYARVSDDDYFDDLSNDLADTSTSALDRAARLDLVAPGLRFSLLAQDFQTLANTRDDNDRSRDFTQEPYARLPQAHLQLLTPSAPFRFGLDAEFDNFKRSGGVDAYRSQLRPRVLWGVDHGGWFVDSAAAYDVTRYQLRDIDRSADSDPAQRGADNDDVINRDIPIFRAGAGLRFARSFANGWVQTLEPRLQYRYTGYQNQSNIPVFDTGVANLRYARLFASNRFVGRDRIGDANQLALGVTSRFIAPENGRYVARLDFGRVTGFRDLKVRLPGAGESGYGERGSDYVAAAEFEPTAHIHARAALQYDPDDSQVNRAIAAAGYARADGYRFDLAYRRYRHYRPRRETGADGVIDLIDGRFETLEQTAASAYVPLGHGIDVIGRWNYSLARSQNVETLAGLAYRPSCCWATRIAWRRYVANDDGSYDHAILFQFVLKGLGAFGDRVHSVVNQNVFSAQRRARRRDDFGDIGFGTIGLP